MRVVFVNMHTIGFLVKNIKRIFLNQRTFDKHRFMLDWFMSNDVEVANFVTLDGTFLPSASLKKITRSYFFRKMEANYVIKRNGIDCKKVKTLTSVDELRADDIIIYYSHYRNVDSLIKNNTPGIKIVNHHHFYGDVKTADKLKQVGLDYYMCEIDLQKYCKLFNESYSWFEGGYINVPFAYQPRFKVLKEFRDRKNKAVAMGTLTKCDFPDFVRCYKTDAYQPRRQMIFDNADRLSPLLDSYITEYLEDSVKEVLPTDNLFVKTRKKWHNFYNSGRQKKYFSFDMVEKYNEYKMFICPEDALGSYGIGNVEGMACGCAMIGWNYGAFEDLGMVAGKHYIAYDGTLEDLEAKISYYQMDEHQEELEQIAAEGCKFVRERFSRERVAREVCEKLMEISKKGKK